MLGPSGSGKTTTLRVIAASSSRTKGSVELRGKDVSRLPPYARDVNTVFQDYALFPHMTVQENVEYGLRVKKVPRAERRSAPARRSRSCGSRATAPASRRSSPAASGSVSRSPARSSTGPQALLLDEPLGALDLKLRQELQVELKRIQQELGITFVYVTHDQEEALTMSDRLAVFNEGRIEQIGAPAEVYEHPASEFIAGFVGVVERARAGRPPLHGAAGEDPPARRGRAAGGRARRGGGADRDVVYVGAITRYHVELDAGGELIGAQPEPRGWLERGVGATGNADPG